MSEKPLSDWNFYEKNTSIKLQHDACNSGGAISFTKQFDLGFVWKLKNVTWR